MNVKQLIEILSKMDGDLTVGVLHDNGITLCQEVGIYEGKIDEPFGNKMIYHRSHKRYVLLGNPGDFDRPAYHDNNNPIEVYDVFQDGTIEKEVL